MRLLFDLDGTLSNPFLGFSKSVQYSLEKLGREVPDSSELRKSIGPPLEETFYSLLNTSDTNLVNEAIRLYRQRYGSVGLFENEVYSGIKESLLVLRDQGYEMSVATSKPSVFASRIVKRFDLDSYFCSVDGCELDGSRGTKEALIAHILRRDDLEPKNVLMVGDRKYDVLGASRNGIETIGVLWGFGSQEELQSAGASLLVETPSELPLSVTQVLKR